MTFYIVVPTGVRGVMLARSLDADAFYGALPPYVLATWSCATLLPKRPACDKDVFSHANKSS
jgi:hypothetical protein